MFLHYTVRKRPDAEQPHMPRIKGKVSTPAKLAYASMRLTPAEKQKMAELAEAEGITLSWAMYRGAILYMTDYRERLEQDLADHERARMTPELF